MDDDVAPAIHCLMMTVSEKGLPMHSTVVNVKDAPGLEAQGWVFVGIDPQDQRDYEYWIYARQFLRKRWQGRKGKIG